MIDRTNDFIKATRECRKVLGLPPKSILAVKKKAPKSTFEIQSREIVKNISKLRDFLVENRRGYIGGHGVDLSDRDRDQIDADGGKFMKICSASLEVLKQELQTNNSSVQLTNHRRFVVEIIEKYLKSIFRIYSEQRAVRVKQVVERKTISRLQSDSMRLKTPAKIPDNADRNAKYKFDESDDDGFSEEEETFAQENAQMLSDMNSLADEVRSIEGKVVEIAKLQEMFSEQVFQQEADIELVAEKVIESSENVKGGNEELREAIKNNAGFRVWVLFFLVMCSFSLLFLEWYS